MDRIQILREILSDEDLKTKYGLKNVETTTTSPPYANKLVEVLSVIINENDNHMTETQIYRKIKNVLNIG